MDKNMDKNMNKSMSIRLLRESEIEIRGQQAGKSQSGFWGLFLLFKDARVDMRILDETFGVLGWQRSHQLIDNNLYCTIEIWDSEKSQWVSKQDVGTPSEAEAEKGQASDAFKRAGFNIGIGRELYTAPTIFINLNDDEVYEQDGKVKVSKKVKFIVSEIEYNNNREISLLNITDSKGIVRFSWVGDIFCDFCKEKVAEYKGRSPETILAVSRKNLNANACGSCLAEKLKK